MWTVADIQLIGNTATTNDFQLLYMINIPNQSFQKDYFSSDIDPYFFSHETTRVFNISLTEMANGCESVMEFGGFFFF